MEKMLTPQFRPVEVDSTRDLRFGEILVIKDSGVEIYNTTGLNECPAELWDNLDVDKLKIEFNAKAVQLNGPKFWMMDEQTVNFGETKAFGGIEARIAAVIDPNFLAKDKGSKPYEIFNPKKTQKMIYKKSMPVYELVDEHGHAYVMQAHDKQFPIAALDSLGEKLQLPHGWSYRTRTLEEDLILDLKADSTIYAIGDQFHQYYTRVPE